jgi:hypothetical protein
MAPWDISEGMLGSYNKVAYSLIFTAALSRIAKLWKQPRFPMTNEWIKKRIQ